MDSSWTSAFGIFFVSCWLRSLIEHCFGENDHIWLFEAGVGTACSNLDTVLIFQNFSLSNRVWLITGYSVCNEDKIKVMQNCDSGRSGLDPLQ